MNSTDTTIKEDWGIRFNRIVNVRLGEVSDGKETILVFFEPIKLAKKLKAFIANELRKEYARGQLDEITAIRQLKEPQALTEREDEIRKEAVKKTIKYISDNEGWEESRDFYNNKVDDILLRLSQGRVK